MAPIAAPAAAPLAAPLTALPLPAWLVSAFAGTLGLVGSTPVCCFAQP